MKRNQPRAMPPSDLVATLKAAYPCPAFNNNCSAVATWHPEKGHIPRGFTGATGTIAEVRVILLTAEPGSPKESESYPATSSPESLFGQAHEFAYRLLMEDKNPLHHSLRSFMDLVFPGESLEEQLRKVWIAPTRLCSAKWAGASVAAASERECAQRYLEPLLHLWPGSPIVAFGAKARRRITQFVLDPAVKRGVIFAQAVSPPECNKSRARMSWASAAEKVRTWQVSG